MLYIYLVFIMKTIGIYILYFLNAVSSELQIDNAK